MKKLVFLTAVMMVFAVTAYGQSNNQAQQNRAQTREEVATQAGTPQSGEAVQARTQTREQASVEAGTAQSGTGEQARVQARENASDQSVAVRARNQERKDAKAQRKMMTRQNAGSGAMNQQQTQTGAGRNR